MKNNVFYCVSITFESGLVRYSWFHDKVLAIKFARVQYNDFFVCDVKVYKYTFDSFINFLGVA